MVFYAPRNQVPISDEQLFIIFTTFGFLVPGLFGNVQLLWTLARKPHLRSKSGSLLGLNAFIHLICLISEFITVILLLFNRNIDSYFCFPFMIPMAYCITLQCFVTMCMAFEMIYAFLYPLHYMHLQPSQYLKYVFFVLLVPFIFCTFIVIEGFRSLSFETITVCNAHLDFPALKYNLRFYWMYFGNIANGITFILYATAIYIFRNKGVRNKQLQKRIWKQSAILILSFMLTYFTANAAILITSWTNATQTTIKVVNMLTIVPVLACFSQNFYICLWRSHDYRCSFMEQLDIMQCKEPQIYDYKRHDQIIRI